MTWYFLVLSFKNLKPPVPVPEVEEVVGADEQVVCFGRKHSQAEETLDATAVCNEAAVDVPTQLPAHAAVPVGENTAEDPEVQELQKASRSCRLAVNCLLNELTQLFPPQLGGEVGFGGGEDLQEEPVTAALFMTGLGMYFASSGFLARILGL